MLNSLFLFDFLKLDTEGSELSILEGATDLLKKQKILDLIYLVNNFFKKQKICKFATRWLTSDSHVC